MFEGEKLLVTLSVVLVAIFIWWGFSVGSVPDPVSHEGSVINNGAEHQITLTEDGFVPKELSIDQGDTVVFKNQTEKPFWPASNLHPSHRDYPEFDPREPIAVDASWKFTFRKVGTWKFHDHLAPYYTGVIIVKE